MMMRLIGRGLCATGALGGLITLVAGLPVAVSGPTTASATTGPSRFLPPPKYHVPARLVTLYRGQYVLRSTGGSARLSGGAMGIEPNNNGFLNGVAQFYGYDTQGFQTSWAATLYNFHQTARGVMIIDVLGPAGRPLLGRLFVQRSKSGDLVGQIQLDRQRYAISWHKITSL